LARALRDRPPLMHFPTRLLAHRTSVCLTRSPRSPERRVGPLQGRARPERRERENECGGKRKNGDGQRRKEIHSLASLALNFLKALESMSRSLARVSLAAARALTERHAPSSRSFSAACSEGSSSGLLWRRSVSSSSLSASSSRLVDDRRSYASSSSSAAPSNQLQLIKALREKSGAPVTDVKAALVEAEWDEGKSVGISFSSWLDLFFNSKDRVFCASERGNPLFLSLSLSLSLTSLPPFPLSRSSLHQTPPSRP